MKKVIFYAVLLPAGTIFLLIPCAAALHLSGGAKYVSDKYLAVIESLGEKAAKWAGV